MAAISDTWFHMIKGATRDLIKVCGGPVRACKIAMVSDTEVSRWQCSSQQAIIPITAVLALEAECGLSLVTGAMAGLNGRKLADAEADPALGAGALRRFAETSRLAVDLIGQGVVAASDGAITPAEAQGLTRVAGELASAAQLFKADLAAIQARETGGETAARMPLRSVKMEG